MAAPKHLAPICTHVRTKVARGEVVRGARCARGQAAVVEELPKRRLRGRAFRIERTAGARIGYPRA